MQLPLSRRNDLIIILALAAVVLAGTVPFFFRGEDPQFVEYRMLDTLESPTAIAAGADGAVWFTIDRSDVIGRVQNGTIQRISTSGRNLEPLGVGAAPDGAAWFTDAVAGAVARVTPTGEVSRLKLDTPIVRLGRLAVGSDGSVWFAESTSYSITQIKDGRIFYVYPDPTVCVCLYVGDQNAYATYRQNVFQQNLADEQAMTAETMEMNNWDWGPWGGYPMGWYY